MASDDPIQSQWDPDPAPEVRAGAETQVDATYEALLAANAGEPQHTQGDLDALLAEEGLDDDAFEALEAVNAGELPPEDLGAEEAQADEEPEEPAAEEPAAEEPAAE